MGHRNARLTPITRLELVQEVADGWSQAEVARQFRISRPTVQRWVRRYRWHGEAGLEIVEAGAGPLVKPPPAGAVAEPAGNRAPCDVAVGRSR